MTPITSASDSRSSGDEPAQQDELGVEGQLPLHRRPHFRLAAGEPDQRFCLASAQHWLDLRDLPYEHGDLPRV
jgi:hypothetical protein